MTKPPQATAASEPPRTFQTDLRRLPEGLKPLQQLWRWVVWRRKRVRGKWTKVPYQPRRPARHAKVNNPTTWATYEEALSCFDLSEGWFSGIGFVLTDSSVGALDLDHCIDPKTGEIAPWAWELVKEAACYTERTVGGAGLRIIGRVAGDPVHRKHKIPGSVNGQVEVFRNAPRYITVSGLAEFGEEHQALNNIDGVIDSVEARYARDEPTHRTKVTAAPDHAAGGGLAAGDISEADVDPALLRTIREGVPVGVRSEAFHRVVGDLRDEGASADQICRLLAKYPHGIAAKYRGRLPTEVHRSYAKMIGGAHRRRLGPALAPVPLKAGLPPAEARRTLRDVLREARSPAAVAARRQRAIDEMLSNHSWRFANSPSSHTSGSDDGDQ